VAQIRRPQPATHNKENFALHGNSKFATKNRFRCIAGDLRAVDGRTV